MNRARSRITITIEYARHDHGVESLAFTDKVEREVRRAVAFTLSPDLRVKIHRVDVERVDDV
jgi:hypothetical protein